MNIEMKFDRSRPGTRELVSVASKQRQKAPDYLRGSNRSSIQRAEEHHDPQEDAGERRSSSLRHAMQIARRHCANDVHRQIATIEGFAKHKGNGRQGPMQPSIQPQVFQCVHQFVSDYLRAAGVRLRNIDEFSRKHLLRGLTEMEKRDCDAAHSEDMVWCLRCFFDAVGKRFVVPNDVDLESLMIRSGLRPLVRKNEAPSRCQ